MANDGSILSTYRGGSEEARLDIYLAYPSLRARFDEIEREEGAGISEGKMAMGRVRFPAQWRARATRRRTGRE